MALSTCQTHALDKIMQWLYTDNAPFFVLSGAAGTGKSYLLQELLVELKQRIKFDEMLSIPPNILDKRVYLTATTNNALTALPYAEVIKTIYSFYRIRVRTDFKSGSTFLTFPAVSTDQFPTEQSLIVIDEASMLTDNLMKHVAKNCYKVLFVCDLAQLPPVGMPKPILPIDPKWTVDMVTNQRSIAAPDLIRLINNYRSAILNGQNFFDLKCDNIEYLDQQTFTEHFLETVRKGVSAKYLSNDNRSAIDCNNFILQNLRGYTSFVKADSATVFSIPEDSGLKMSQEVYIQRAENSERLINKRQILGQKVFIEGDKTFFVPNDINDLTTCLAELRQDYDLNKQTITAIMYNWIDLRPCYGLTIRRSQGQSYDVVYLDLKTLSKIMFDPYAVTRLLYVAISRARFKVYITGEL